MDSIKKINAFSKLGVFLYQFAPGEVKKKELNTLNGLFYDRFNNIIQTEYQYNGWFTEENVRFAISSLARTLKREALEKWIDQHKNELVKKKDSKKVAVIMAGNIPLVGFHDFLCVLISGHSFIGKLSSDDKHLLPLIAEILIQEEPAFESCIRFQENKVSDIDAVIATGSNNSARYFEYYFGKYPHIIRKNRNSIAVLDGTETKEELQLLGTDIFQYFGLGCRNISKLFVPEGYGFDTFFEAMYVHQEIINNNKYANNYNYNRAIYLMKGAKFLDNNFLLLKEDKAIASPVAVLFYEQYKDWKQLTDRLKTDATSIQCVISKNKKIKNAIEPGQAQYPSLSDYADGEDTMKFLINL